MANTRSSSTIVLNSPQKMSVNAFQYQQLEKEFLETFLNERQEAKKAQTKQRKSEELKATSDLKELQEEAAAWFSNLLNEEAKAQQTKHTSEKMQLIQEYKRLSALVTDRELMKDNEEELQPGDEPDLSVLDCIEQVSNTVHPYSVLAAATTTIFELVEMYYNAPQIICDFFGLFVNAMNVALITLIVGSAIATGKAIWNKETEDRNIVILGGFNRIIQGIFLAAINLGMIAAASFVGPILFYGLVLGFGFEEHAKLQKRIQEREQLENEIEPIREQLRNRLVALNRDLEKAQDDPQVLRLSVEIAKMEIKINILETKEASLRESRNLFFRHGMICATLFLTASVICPFFGAGALTAGILVALTLSAFYWIGNRVGQIKKNEAKNIAGIEKQDLLKRAKRVVNTAIQNLAFIDKDDPHSPAEEPEKTILIKKMQGSLFFKPRQARVPIIGTPVILRNPSLAGGF